MNTDERLHSITEFVKGYLEKSYGKRKDKKRLERLLMDDVYRWQHTLRVAQFGKVIAEKESANTERVTAACILHDLAWFNTTSENSREHGRIGADLARPFLVGLKYTSKQVDDICYSIAAHVDVEDPVTLEARIVSDADNVDRFGPYRVLQWCFSDLDDYERLTMKLSERIKRLEQYRKKNPLFTSTGKSLFKEQLDLQINFFRAFVGEKELTVNPWL